MEAKDKIENIVPCRRMPRAVMVGLSGPLFPTKYLTGTERKFTNPLLFYYRVLQIVFYL